MRSEHTIDQPAPPRRVRGRPRKAESLAIRADILVAARASFAENGFAASSAETIALRAGVTRKTFYHHFADKAAVFQAVTQEDLLHFEQALPLDLGDLDRDTALRRVAEALMNLWVEPLPSALRMIIAEGVRFPHLAAMLGESTRQVAVRVAAILRDHACDDVDVDVERAASVFVRMVYMGAQEWMLTNPLEPFPRALQQRDVEDAVQIFGPSWEQAFRMV